MRALGTFIVLLALSLTTSGCLPILIGSAKTLKPGEFSLAFAGQGRGGRLPEGIERTGPATGIVEMRGGVPGERMEAGFTLQVPWHVVWDMKVSALAERRILPAVAAQVHMGLIFQPSYGASLLVTKTFGPFEITAMGGAGRTNERFWRSGSGPFSDNSENYIKDVYSTGGGIEYRLSPIHSILVNFISWRSASWHETAKDGRPFGVREEPACFLSAGIRVRWTVPPSKRTGALVVLRGYILGPLEGDRFPVGQPGIYRATVLVDIYTRITRSDKPAGRESLMEKRAVLIQGIALPQPATFLARTIELQN